jgi:hypothetical protein
MIYQYENLNDEISFEEFICDLFNEIYQSHSFLMYQSKGSKQHGIDIFSTEHRTVIQCKKKDLMRKDNHIQNELIEDFDKSIDQLKELPFSFHKFIFVSNTKRYSRVQNHIVKKAQEFTFDSQFWSWKEIERHISRYETIRSKYFPHLAAPSKSPRPIKVLPPLNSIGADALLKQAIQTRFNKIGESREKRFGKKAYAVMYNNFKRDFQIGKAQWTIVWTWPVACADAVIKYLDDKYANTIAGRLENATKRSNYLHTRPNLYKKEIELLSHLGYSLDSEFVKDSLKRFFGVTSHTMLSHLEHWQWVCHLEAIVQGQVYDSTQ